MNNIQRSTIAILAVSFVIVFINIAVSLTPSSHFCRPCHSSEYETWKNSSHRRVGCNDCHRRPDFFGFVDYRVKVVRMTANYFTYFFYDRPVTSSVPTQACRSCHVKEETRTLVVRDLRISHKELVKSGYECTLCHSTVTHSKSVPDPRGVTMNQCFFCHNGQEASSDCDTCHAASRRWTRRNKQGPWQITHGEQWRRLHGMGNVSQCSVCHRSNFCARCHGIDLPHPDFWLNLHAKPAQENRKSCLSCHKEQLCSNCHKIEMPHPPSFLPRHAGEMKRLGKQKCFQCHLEQGCDRCHAAHIHPGLPPDQLERLKKEAGLD